VIGGTIALLGYQGAQIVLHLVMAALYAFSLAYCLTGLRLSAVDALLALGIFVLVGPDLMGGEWLFLGVEPKTFAYAFVLFALGLVCRERAGWAAAALVSRPISISWSAASGQSRSLPSTHYAPTGCGLSLARSPAMLRA
jgi:hypothetical protein